jgi:hypothetical protein
MPYAGANSGAYDSSLRVMVVPSEVTPSLGRPAPVPSLT